MSAHSAADIHDSSYLSRRRRDRCRVLGILNRAAAAAGHGVQFVVAELALGALPGLKELRGLLRRSIAALGLQKLGQLILFRRRGKRRLQLFICNDLVIQFVHRLHEYTS